MPRRDVDDGKEKKKSSKKRSRSQYFDEDEDDRAKLRKPGSEFFDLEAMEDDSVEEDDHQDEDDEDDFIVDDHELPDTRTLRGLPRLPHVEDDQEDVVALERSIRARYARYDEEDEETRDDVVVEQQALLPSVRDPKLWMVKCAIGHEREVAVCLMQKCIDRGGTQIRSAIALDHLENYVYIEADKEGHVKEACKGIRNIFTGSKILLVPIKEMTDVLSVESRKLEIEVSRDTWVRMKNGTYKGDLAQVVDVDNERRRVTVKLIPRIDLQALANMVVEGRQQLPKKKTFTPPPRFMNVALARQMHIRVQSKRDRVTGDYFENINGMLFKDGFLYKNVSLKSISTQGIQPSLDEAEKFLQGDNGDGDMASLSTLFSNRKKGNFMKGDRVKIVEGDLKNLKGVVEKVEGGTVQIKPYDEGLPKTLAVSEKELCKYFEPGNHVKVVSGATQGATGMVVTVERHLVNIVSDTTKEVIQVFSDNVVEISSTSEVTSCKTRIPNRVPQAPAGRMPRGGHQMNSGGRFGDGRGHNSLIGSNIRVRLGSYKGCRGIVKDVKGQTVWVELEAQMKIITVNRDAILASSTREPPGYGSGFETPMHPYMTPMRDTLAYS